MKNTKTIPKNPANQAPAEIVEKVLYLRCKYHLGPTGIVWYLARYHGIKLSDASAYHNGHEFQVTFHWHVDDLGVRHAYIKHGRPQLNGNVERSHRSDQQEFYQPLSCKGDVDLEVKPDEWARFYNFARPHGAHNGQTP